jgi:hypothetical protein
LNALQVPDEVCAYFKDLGDYDYRPAREVAEGDEDTEVRSLIDVDKCCNASDGLTGRRQHSLSLLLPKMYCAATILQT